MIVGEEKYSCFMRGKEEKTVKAETIFLSPPTPFFSILGLRRQIFSLS